FETADAVEPEIVEQPAPPGWRRRVRMRRQSDWWKPAAAVAAIAIGAWWLTRTPAAPNTVPAVGVLAFANLSGDAAVDQFAEGVTGDVTAALARIPELRVARYRCAGSAVAAIGAQLKVNAVLEGSVRRDGDRYRITAQLINVADGYHLWAETYDRIAPDAMALQKQTSELISSALAERIVGRAQWRSAGRSTASSEVLALYLKAGELLRIDPRLAVWTGKMPDELEESVRLYEQAVRLDPGFAKAWAGLAQAAEFATDYEKSRAAEMKKKALAAARKALDLDPTLAEAHASLGLYYLRREWNYAAAESEFRRAVELNPRNMTPWRDYSDVLRVTGKLAQAEAEVARALRTDPRSALLHTQQAIMSLGAGRPAEAIAAAGRALQLQADFRTAHWALGAGYEATGRLPEAEEKYRLVLALAPYDARALSSLGHLLGRMGRREEAGRLLALLGEMYGKGRNLGYSVALVRLGLGDRAGALEWLEKAAET
ncbi:MAG: tetratricopeptide repeat protein, partial [Bryobacteraceae bacterium]